MNIDNMWVMTLITIAILDELLLWMRCRQLRREARGGRGRHLGAMAAILGPWLPSWSHGGPLEMTLKGPYTTVAVSRCRSWLFFRVAGRCCV